MFKGSRLVSEDRNHCRIPTDEASDTLEKDDRRPRRAEGRKPVDVCIRRREKQWDEIEKASLFGMLAYSAVGLSSGKRLSTVFEIGSRTLSFDEAEIDVFTDRSHRGSRQAVSDEFACPAPDRGAIEGDDR